MKEILSQQVYIEKNKAWSEMVMVYCFIYLEQK